MKRPVQIQWPSWEKIINKAFLPLIGCRDRYLILYGGRGSSKSDFTAKKLIFRCLTEKYFKAILVRNAYNSIKDSSYQTIRDIIVDMGLQELFEFKLNPLEIVCRNGNTFLARGCDDTTRLKSIKDPSAVWYEEDIPTEPDWITISSGVRTRKAEYLQEIFSLNPECEGDYQLSWFWKRFFEGKEGLSFQDKTMVEVKPGVTVELAVTVHHSTYKDNRWISMPFVAAMEDLKRTDSYYYQVYCLGRWGQRVRATAAYKQFAMGRNTAPVCYNKELPLWVSFDFNVLPGVSCGIFQVEGKIMRMIGEIQLPPPRNNTKAVCKEIIRLYQGHIGGMMVTGDPAGRHKDTRGEDSYNDFDIIIGSLAQFRPSLRVHTSAPPVVPRMNFINTVFESGYNGISLTIGSHCEKMIADLLNGQEDGDGTKRKEKVRDPKTGASIERYHHFTDLLDYAVITVFYNEFKKYLTGGGPSFPTRFGRNAPNKKLAY
ncbi:MAG TPA: PBSX family phage terminase large subunit [Puia sp.]|jgi:hypothetical protein|nr:PBSX family phage terminase large subunit [Puia sp.]